MSNFSRVSSQGVETHFTKGAVGEIVRSRMTASPEVITTFNAGRLIPIYYAEILPDEVIHELDVRFDIRQSTLLTPTMGTMIADFYAFFVPHRIVNDSLKAVMGENYQGTWTADNVVLAPLKVSSVGFTRVPVHSVADYYGFPWQRPIPNSTLALCNDLKFRGYVMIYNEFFRDQNYQPPIPMSTLNVYQGFMDDRNQYLLPSGSTLDPSTSNYVQGVGNGAFSDGAVSHAIFGASGNTDSAHTIAIGSVPLSSRFYALGEPLRVNKLHDFFTSGLPSPQKSNELVYAPVSGTISNSIPVTTSMTDHVTSYQNAMHWISKQPTAAGPFYVTARKVSGEAYQFAGTVADPAESAAADGVSIQPSNLETVPGATVDGLAISINDLRYAAAVQQVCETLGIGGSRYRSFVKSFFGIEVDDPFSDVPQYLGHFRKNLDLFQTAQTSPSVSQSTPQGNLAAFGYTSSSGKLVINHRFLEHGYLHVFCVVRHRNLYSSMLLRDNFRTSLLDFYVPPLANLSNQPVYSREINAFVSDPSSVFNYQEAWWEYRVEPDRVTGSMRAPVPGDANASDSLALWNYADYADPDLTIEDGDWLLSNSQEVLDRSLAVTSSVAPQFKGQFKFFIDKELPMPVYSLPGLDFI